MCRKIHVYNAVVSWFFKLRLFQLLAHIKVYFLMEKLRGICDAFFDANNLRKILLLSLSPDIQV